MTLFENYKSRLAISEGVYAKAHNGEKMDQNRKLVTAKCLENINKFMNEAFESSQGTQRTDMGLFKKFTLNLTTVTLPNLIANDIVIVHPMSAMSGYITYIEYSTGTAKGGTAAGTLVNSPFKLGNVDVNYTSSNIVTEAKASTGASGAYTATLKWKPIIKGTVEIVNGASTFVDHDGKLFLSTDTTFATEKGTIDYDTGVITLTAGSYVASTTVLANYVYNNEVVPQNDLPTLRAEMKSIALVAKARRITIYYSQIAAFQAKTDYGMDLGDQLAEKAVGELSYEIDTEVTDLLIANAATSEDLTWSKTQPVGVSKSDHFEGFVEILEIAKQKIYDATKKFAPNYVLIASNVLPVLSMVKGFKAAPAGQINGPYLAGTINGLKVFVTPNIARGHFVVGCNGADMMSSAAVYAPYMAIVPTQLLGFADGGMSQGWSTLYDLKILNASLLIQGQITD